MIDIYTRVILGFYIGPEGESLHRCGKAIANAILPKEGLIQSLGLEKGLYYPMHGVWEDFHADFAKAHRSPTFRAALLYAGVVNPEARGRGGPEKGGHIERLIGTMMGRCHFLPGRTGRNVQNRGDYDSESDACLTLLELERWFMYEVIAYHERTHLALGMPPALKWRIETASNPPVPFQGDPVHLARLCLPRKECTVRSVGISLQCQRFASPVLSQHIGQRVYVHYDPHDASQVYALINGEFLTLPCSHKLPWTGISFIELKERRTRLKSQVADYRRTEGSAREQRSLIAARGVVVTARRRKRAQRKPKGTSVLEALVKEEVVTPTPGSSAFVNPASLERWTVIIKQITVVNDNEG